MYLIQVQANHTIASHLSEHFFSTSVSAIWSIIYADESWYDSQLRYINPGNVSGSFLSVSMVKINI